MADDLGYGDLSCYGQTKFQTPNIAQLAATGMRFTQHYSGCTVCAPSRSSLMIGLHTGHTFISGNKEIQPEGQQPLEARAITMAELLKEAGYATGAFGKWGLGFPGSEGEPNDAQQLELFQTIFPILWEHPAVGGITFWGYIEGKMWMKRCHLVRIDGTWRPALIWLKDYLAKNPR